MKHFITFIAVTLCIQLAAQEKLTLEEAVLGQSSRFAPARLAQLQWIPGTDDYSFSANDSLYRVDPKGKRTLVLTLQGLRAMCAADTKAEWKALPAVEWIDEKTLYTTNAGDYLQVDVVGKHATRKCILPEEGENADYHAKTARLAFTMENNLYVQSNGGSIPVTRNEPGIVCGQSISRNEYGITKGTFWSPSGDAIAFYRKDERNVTDYPMTRYSVIPAETEMIKYPMAGKSSEIVGVGIYQVTEGKTIYLDLFGVEPETDQFYVNNLTWSPDGRHIYVVWLNRKTDELKVREFDAITGQEKNTVLREMDNRWLEPEQPLTFIPGRNDRFLWHSWRDGFHNYYLYSTDGTLISHTNASFELTEIIGFSADNRVMFVHGTGPIPTEMHAYAVNLETMKIVQLTQQHGQHNVMVSDKSNYILDSFSNTETPFRTDLSRNGKTIRTIHNAKNPLTGRTIGKTEIFTLNSNDGVPLYCRLIKPSNFNPEKRYPVIVYLYNGPHVQLVTDSWLAGASLWMHHLAEEGYLIFSVDGRGSAHRGKEFEQAIHRQLGTVEISDQEQGVNWLRNQPWVDDQRLAVHGWSFGGFMTTSLMLRKPGLFKAGVAGGPVIDWRLYEVMYTERYMDTPEENPDGYATADLTRYVKDLQGDLMLIHGSEDDVVVLQHSMNFLKKCIDENVQVDFFVYPGHAHNVRGKDRLHLMEKIIGYLREKLED